MVSSQHYCEENVPKQGNQPRDTTEQFEEENLWLKAIMAVWCWCYHTVRELDGCEMRTSKGGFSGRLHMNEKARPG